MTEIEMNTEDASWHSSELANYIVELRAHKYDMINHCATVNNNWQSTANLQFQEMMAGLISELSAKVEALQDLKSGLDRCISAHEEAARKLG
jgi:uncharacterized protein YukE